LLICGENLLWQHSRASSIPSKKILQMDFLALKNRLNRLVTGFF
jgi:hypothetical protein